MGQLEGRVAVITGAGRGLGREHALLFASEGARVVVNDLGGAPDGAGADETAAESVASEIRAAGGEAVANGDDIATWDGAERLIRTAVDAHGGLDVLVNNAGILRDRTLVNMSEDEFDSVIRVHLKGTFCPSRFAAAYWRDQAKAGTPVQASVINTSSGAGLHANPGQANYGTAKSGIATMTQIMAKELQRYGVRVNAIAPGARTRLTAITPGLADMVQPPEDEAAFDQWHPANVSPLVAFLATADCEFTGNVFGVYGGEVIRYDSWAAADTITNDGRWTLDDLATAMKQFPPVASMENAIDAVTK